MLFRVRGSIPKVVGRRHPYSPSALSATGSTASQIGQIRSFSSTELPDIERFHVSRSGHFYSIDPEPRNNTIEAYEHPTIPRKKFVKTIRAPIGLYNTVYDTLLMELRGEKSGALFPEFDQQLTEVISDSERDALLDSIMGNMIFPKIVCKYADKATKSTMLFPAGIYTHMSAGLGNYCLQKTGRKDIKDAYRYVTYYRSGMMLEELYRLGYSKDDAIRLIAKGHFMQYHAGDPFGPNRDKDLFSNFKRVFYPWDCQVSEGSTDLGRDHEIETARLFCMGYEGMTPPVTILSSGDTGMFTDGALNSIQHLVEASERDFKMPLVYLVQSNNSAISTRWDKGREYGVDNGDVCILKIMNRFAQYESLIDPGFVVWTQDMKEGLEVMRQAVDQVLETGRPTYVISRFPFRPGGHAADQNPSPEPIIVDQFKKTKDLYLQQLAASCPAGTTGSQLADLMEEFNAKATIEVEKAVKGTFTMTRDDAREMSEPGILMLEKEAGDVVPLTADYLMNRNQTEFAGMGSDIYGRSINKAMDECTEQGRPMRYVHQENHYKGDNDTRGGVYGELNAVGAHNTDLFVNLFPQEAQVMQVGAAYRSVLPENNLIFVKGPHTIFNEHARDIMKYGAFMQNDRGIPGNVVYLFDGGSIATWESFKFKDENTGEERLREMWLAKVGEHHNTAEASSYAADANMVMCMPLDMNFVANYIPEMIRLHDLGRTVVTVAPTTSFGFLHPKFTCLSDMGKEKFTINDVIKVDLSQDAKVKPMNGRKLVVLSWGPDSKFITKAIANEGLDCELFILGWNRCPNALVQHMQQYVNQDVDILVIDQNVEGKILGPVVVDLKRKLGNPRSWHWEDCTVKNTYIPYGNGAALLNKDDVIESLKQMGALAGGQQVQAQSFTAAAPSSSSPAGGAAASAAGGASGAGGPGLVIVNAPMDGEGVYLTFHKKVGDSVTKGEVVLEVESDKATIEVAAPSDGIIKEFFQKEQDEMDVTPDTKFFSMEASGGGAPAASAPAAAAAGSSASGGGEVVIVNAPMDGEGVYLTFHKKVGESCSKGDVVVEVESDKATIEVAAPADGVVTEFFQKEQDEMDVSPDTKFFSFEKSGGGGGGGGAAPDAPAAAPAAAASGAGEIITINAPMDGEGVYLTFHKKVGESCAKGDVIVEVESDKATIEVAAPSDGTVVEFLQKEQDEMDVSPETAFFKFEKAGAAAAAPPASALTSATPAAAVPAASSTVTDSSGDREVELTRVERAMVKAMTIQPTDTRTFNQFDTVSFDAIRAEAKAAGVTPPIVVVKRLGHALENLDLNKKLSKDRKTMLYKKQIDIGMAVDVGFGLRTCAIRDVTNKSLEEINADVQGFVASGKGMKPEVMDLSNVCWTVTSLGKLAGQFAVSVLPPGTSGILSLGKKQENGQSFISLCMCHATLAGKEGATLLQRFREGIE